MTLIWIGHVLEFQSFGNGIESLLGTGSLKSLMSALSRLTVFFFRQQPGVLVIAMWTKAKTINIVPQNFKKSRKKNLKASITKTYQIKWKYSGPLQRTVNDELLL